MSPTSPSERPPEPQSAVKCHGEHLAPGDVVQIGQRRCTIVHICQPFLHSFRQGTVRHALVMWQDDDKPEPYCFRHFSNSFFHVTGGPKLAAKSQLRRMPAGYLLWSPANG